MRIKLVKNKPKSTALVKSSSNGKSLTLSDIKLPKPIIDASMALAVPPLFIVESWLGNACSRRLFNYITSNIKLFNSLKEIEQNPTIYDLVVKNRFYTLTAAERRAIENRFVTEKILNKQDELLDNMFTLAKGFELQTVDKKGDRVYVDVGPNIEANRYLLDRALGKPVATAEGDGTTKGAVQNVIILPSNGRGDEVLATAKQISQVIDVPFREEVEEDGGKTS